MMKKASEISTLTTDFIEQLDGSVSYHGEMILNDNFQTRANHGMLQKLKKMLPLKTNYITIIICTAGSMSVTISLKEHIVEKSDVMLIGSGQVIENMSGNDDCHAVAITITPESVFAAHQDRCTEMIRKYLYLSQPVVTRLSETEFCLAMTMFRQMGRIILEAGHLFKEEALLGCLMVLSSHIMNNIHAIENQEGQSICMNGNTIMKNFLAEVGKNYTHERSISFYAGKLCISPKYFAQVILQESGRYAKDWIQDFVIRDAKSMLKSGNRTVQEVSDALHFSSPSSFGRYFKHAVGCTPVQFRKTIACS